jgi:hypothetical protein
VAFASLWGTIALELRWNARVAANKLPCLLSIRPAVKTLKGHNTLLTTSEKPLLGATFARKDCITERYIARGTNQAAMPVIWLMLVLNAIRLNLHQDQREFRGGSFSVSYLFFFFCGIPLLPIFHS